MHFREGRHGTSAVMQRIDIPCDADDIPPRTYQLDIGCEIHESHTVGRRSSTRAWSRVGNRTPCTAGPNPVYAPGPEVYTFKKATKEGLP